MELVNTISMKKTRLKNFSNSGWKIFNMQRKKCCVFKIVWSYEKVQDIKVCFYSSIRRFLEDLLVKFSENKTKNKKIREAQAKKNLI